MTAHGQGGGRQGQSPAVRSALVRPRDARLILQQLRMWEAEGLVSGEQAQSLRERYHDLAEMPEQRAGPHPGVVVLQALGGLVLGAAVIAFTIFLDPGTDADPWLFLAFGIPLLAGGIAASWRGHELGDIAIGAGLVPLTFAAIEADANALFYVVPLIAPIVAAGLRIDSLYVPPLCALAFATGSGIATFALDWDASSWLGLLVLASIASLAPAQLRAKGAWHAASAALVVAVAIAAALTYFDLNMDWGTGGTEVFVALFMGTALAVGIFMRHRGLILGAAIALAVDAIIFAFDVGGPIGGTLTLLLVAAAIIGFATTYAKKIMRE